MTKNRFILLITFSFYALGSPFQLPTNGIRHDLPTVRPPPVTAMTSSDSTDDDAPPLSDFDELIKDETLLRINFSFDDDDGSSHHNHDDDDVTTANYCANYRANNAGV